MSSLLKISHIIKIWCLFPIFHVLIVFAVPSFLHLWWQNFVLVEQTDMVTKQYMHPILIVLRFKVMSLNDINCTQLLGLHDKLPANGLLSVITILHIRLCSLPGPRYSGEFRKIFRVVETWILVIDFVPTMKGISLVPINVKNLVTSRHTLNKVS